MSEKFNGLWIGNLALDTIEEDIRQLFAPYGKIISIRIPRKKNDGTLYGFATCIYEDSSSNEKAIKELDGTTFRGRTLQVTHYDTNKRGSHTSGFQSSDQKGDRYRSEYSSKSSFLNDSDDDDIFQPRNRETDFVTQMDNIAQIIKKSEKHMSIRELNYLLRWAKATKSSIRPTYKKSSWKESDDYSDDYPDKRRYH